MGADFFNEFIKKTLAGWLRLVLAGVISWAVTNNIIADSQVENVLYGIAAGIVIFGWSLWSRYKKAKELKTAADMPKGASLEDIKTIAATKTL